MTPECSFASREPAPPPSASNAWENVTSGRYRITHWYDRDGRRYLVARPNPARPLRPLTDRQRRMLALRARGAALKVIAFEFGVSMGTVSRDLTLAMKRLGLESSADLAAVFGHERELTGAALPPPPGLSIEAGEVDGELLSSFPLTEEPVLPAELTCAERAIVEALLTGLTNVEIAERRGVSQFTVANQVARIFSKLAVHSRLGLALRLRRAA